MPDELDLRRFKSDQSRQWSDVAPGWRRQWRVFEANAQRLSDRLVELARVATGSRVLDVATGIGEPALTAARRVGPTGRVVAVDLAPTMVEIARERALAEGLANVDARVADAEALELPPRSFDAATSRWGLMLMPSPRAALDGIRACLAPGGRLAAAVWGAKEVVPFLATPTAVLEREVGVAPPPGTPGPFTLGAPGALAALLRDAGFEDVAEERFELVFELASPAAHLAFVEDVSGAFRKALGERAPADAERLRAAFLAATAAFATPEGRVRYANEVRIATGRA